MPHEGTIIEPVGHGQEGITCIAVHLQLLRSSPGIGELELPVIDIGQSQLVFNRCT